MGSSHGFSLLDGALAPGARSRNSLTDMPSFDNRPLSFGAAHPADMHRLSQPSSSFRSDSNGNLHANGAGSSQIYTAVYSNISVYEMEINGVAVMRRRSDSWLNATQILKVAGIDKGRRTKILEKEILTGEHEKIQGGYGRYQGTWISYERGRQFCRAYGVDETLRPLLEYDLDNDGNTEGAKNDTPTKEQAMAANRKRFYNSSLDSRLPGSSGTFFSNHSPTVQTAVAAMNKFSRFESPLPRPSSSGRRPTSHLHRQLSQPHSQEPHSQQSNQSLVSDHGLDGLLEGPPRKRMRASFGPQESFVSDETATEVNESFSMPQGPLEQDSALIALPPLDPPESRAQHDRKLKLMDLFVDSAQSEYVSAPVLAEVGGTALDLPLDNAGNTALHWAASLAKIDLVRSLLERGASMFRGNVAGQTPLMLAVQSNNNFDQNTFTQLLELFGPLIELRDAQGRTVVHHIAVSSGVQNRAPSSRYYLESLLEYTVRQGLPSQASSQSQQASASQAASKVKPINLGRFMSEVVNVQDKSGKTALVLAARIGNHAIIDQLEEVGADFYLPDHANFRPVDFGILPKQQSGAGAAQAGSSQATASSQDKAPNHIEQMEREMLATTRAILAQTQEHYGAELSKKQATVDALNDALKAVAQEHKEGQRRHEQVQRRAEEMRGLGTRRDTLQAFVERGKARMGQGFFTRGAQADALPGAPAGFPPGTTGDDIGDTIGLEAASSSYLESLPSASQLEARLGALQQHRETLHARATALRSHSMDKEALYRRAIALTMHIGEDEVDAHLRPLVLAMESEPIGTREADASRIRDFLRKVETVES